MAKNRKKHAGAPRASGETPGTVPDREKVAMRAYELYLARGGGDGQSMDDWLRAEHELLTAGGPSDRSRES